jgi:hypothetical protein
MGEGGRKSRWYVDTVFSTTLRQQKASKRPNALLDLAGRERPSSGRVDGEAEWPKSTRWLAAASVRPRASYLSCPSRWVGQRRATVPVDGRVLTGAFDSYYSLSLSPSLAHYCTLSTTCTLQRAILYTMVHIDSRQARALHRSFSLRDFSAFPLPARLWVRPLCRVLSALCPQIMHSAARPADYST